MLAQVSFLNNFKFWDLIVQANIPKAVYIPALTYLVLYRILDRHPNLVHKKRELSQIGKVKLIGHRGSRNDGLPENTLAAFEDSVVAGADMVELDIWLSADNKVVVFHDETLERMTQGASQDRIAEVKFNDLPKLIPGDGQGERCSMYPSWKYSCIPSLDSVIDNLPSSALINIEFKQDSPILISETLRILSVHKCLHRVSWFSLIEKINKQLPSAEPKIPTVVSVLSMLTVLVQYYLGVLPFCSIPDSIYGITVSEITLEDIRGEAALAGMPDWVLRLLAALFRGRPPAIMIAPGLFRHLRRRGMAVWFLGVDNEEDLRVAAASGATGVLCDRVRWSKSRLDALSSESIRLSDPD